MALLKCLKPLFVDVQYAMCRGGTGFASDISAGLEVQFLSECPAPLHPALPCCVLPLLSALAAFSTQPAFSHLAQVAASIEPKSVTISPFLARLYVSGSKFQNSNCAI